MSETKNKGGRPKAEINLEQVSLLAKYGCTHQEIAAVIGISYSTWKRHLKDNPQIKESLTDGALQLKANLRRKQIELALKGDKTMLIWLGKNILGQADKQHIEQQNLEPLIIVRDTTDESADESIRQSGEVSRSGSGSEIRKDLSRTH